MPDLHVVQNALKELGPSLRAKSNVVATGVGYKVSDGKRTDELCIVCSVTKKLRANQLLSRNLIPALIDGIPTDVIQTGRIRALRTSRHRPAPGGVSIGHVDITAGTLGCLVLKDGELVILSNNHVLANSNDASIGDSILQPGPVDGGKSSDRIATLLDFVPINFGGGSVPPPPSDCPIARAVVSVLNLFARVVGSKSRCQAVTVAAAADNLVDAAIATPLESSAVVDNILDIGPIRGVARASLGDAVKKSGRTTGLTTGEILQVDVTVDVSYGAGKVARFVDQLLSGPMSAGGDSGSAVLNDEDELVGLLFAGSDNTTIFNRIDNVFNELGVSR